MRPHYVCCVILDELRVLNYRSIRTAQTVSLSNGVVLVGPNNVGKSNVLRALELFFCAGDSGAYDIERDLPHRSGGGRTSLRGVFSFEDADDDLWADYEYLAGMVNETVERSDPLPMYLEFSRAGNPSYKLFPSAKPANDRKSDFSRRQSTFISTLLSGFAVRYVPTAKDWDGFFEHFLVPALGEVIERSLSAQLDGVRKELRQIGTTLGDRLKTALDNELSLTLDLAPDLSRVLGAVSIELADPTPTALSGKGQGIQSAFLITAISWISEQERAAGRVPIWLLEEPEAYTHPALARSVVQLVDEARSLGPVIFTTHSLGLVPSDVTLVRGVSRGTDGSTSVSIYTSHSEATLAIREALGVKAADYFGFGAGAVLTEGPSDRAVITWYRDQIAEEDAFPLLRAAALDDYGGVKHLSGFLLGTLGILQNEVPIVSVFDGDKAGDDEVRMLGHRLPKAGVRWSANLDYVALPKGREIEGLFPDMWILEMHADHPGWFEEVPTQDMEGTLIGFKIKDNSKASARGYLQQLGAESPGDLTRLDALLATIENALKRQFGKISSGASA